MYIDYEFVNSQVRINFSVNISNIRLLYWKLKDILDLFVQSVIILLFSEKKLAKQSKLKGDKPYISTYLFDCQKWEALVLGEVVYQHKFLHGGSFFLLVYILAYKFVSIK